MQSVSGYILPNQPTVRNRQFPKAAPVVFVQRGEKQQSFSLGTRPKVQYSHQVRTLGDDGVQQRRCVTGRLINFRGVIGSVCNGLRHFKHKLVRCVVALARPIYVIGPHAVKLHVGGR